MFAMIGFRLRCTLQLFFFLLAVLAGLFFLSHYLRVTGAYCMRGFG